MLFSGEFQLFNHCRVIHTYRFLQVTCESLVDLDCKLDFSQICKNSPVRACAPQTGQTSGQTQQHTETEARPSQRQTEQSKICSSVQRGTYWSQNRGEPAPQDQTQQSFCIWETRATIHTWPQQPWRCDWLYRFKTIRTERLQEPQESPADTKQNFCCLYDLSLNTHVVRRRTQETAFVW